MFRQDRTDWAEAPQSTVVELRTSAAIAHAALAADTRALKDAARLAAHPTGFWDGAGMTQVVEAWGKLDGRLQPALNGQLTQCINRLMEASRLGDGAAMRVAYEAIVACLD